MKNIQPLYIRDDGVVAHGDAKIVSDSRWKLFEQPKPAVKPEPVEVKANAPAPIKLGINQNKNKE